MITAGVEGLEAAVGEEEVSRGEIEVEESAISSLCLFVVENACEGFELSRAVDLLEVDELDSATGVFEPMDEAGPARVCGAESDCLSLFLSASAEADASSPPVYMDVPRLLLGRVFEMLFRLLNPAL